MERTIVWVLDYDDLLIDDFTKKVASLLQNFLPWFFAALTPRPSNQVISSRKENKFTANRIQFRCRVLPARLTLQPDPLFASF